MSVIRENPIKLKILEVAFKIFARKGYCGASIDDIARKAGLTKGGIYHYFEDKEDLYHQVINRYLRGMKRPTWLEKTGVDIEAVVRNGFEYLAKSKKDIQKLVGSQKDDAIFCFYNLVYEATRKYPEFQKSLNEFDSWKRANLANAFRRGQTEGRIRLDQDPEILAFEFDALLQQLQFLCFVDPNFNEEEMITKLFEGYWFRLQP